MATTTFSRFTELPPELQRNIVHLAYLSQEHDMIGTAMPDYFGLVDPPDHRRLAQVCRDWALMLNDPQSRPLYKIPARLRAQGTDSFGSVIDNWLCDRPRGDNITGPFECGNSRRRPPKRMCRCAGTKAQCRQTVDYAVNVLRAEITTNQPLMNHVAQLRIVGFYLGFFSPEGPFSQVVGLLPNLREIFIEPQDYLQENPTGRRATRCGHKSFVEQKERTKEVVHDGLVANVLPIIQHWQSRGLGVRFGMNVMICVSVVAPSPDDINGYLDFVVWYPDALPFQVHLVEGLQRNNPVAERYLRGYPVPTEADREMCHARELEDSPWGRKDYL